MTREEVKAQLAKSPLVWAEDADLIAHVDTGDTTIELHYTIRGDCLLLSTFINSVVAEEFIGQYEDIEYLKCAAEEHRLNLVCSMLGIKE